MEAHFVFYNSLYKTLEEAKPLKNGLTVLALFYDITESYRETSNPFIQYLNNVIQPNTEFRLTYPRTFSIKEMMGVSNWNFIFYRGSLTTPPCTESVIWIVALNPIPIHNEEMLEFRNLKSSEGSMIQNFRPTQKLNHRTLLYY